MKFIEKIKANTVAFFKTIWYMIRTLRTPRAIMSFLIALGSLSGGFLIVIGFIIHVDKVKLLGTIILTGWNTIPFTPLFGLSFIVGIIIQRYLMMDPNAMKVKEIVVVYKNAKEMYYKKKEEGV